jgi:hypothetical protein
MKKLVVVLAIALAGVGAGAIWFWNQLDAERSANAELKDRIMALEVAQQAAALAPPAPVAPAETPATASPATAATAPTQKEQTARKEPGGLAAAAKAVLSTDAGKDMTRTMLRSMMTQQYPDLGKELGLTEAQVNELFDLMTKQQMDLTSESMDLLTGTGDAASMRETQRKLQEKQKANEDEVAAMLGSKYPQFQEFQGTQAARMQVSQLQNALGTSGITALTDSQKKSLITALGAEQKLINEDNRNALGANRGAQAGSPNYLDQQLQQATDSNRRLLNVASGHLNGQQLDAYRKMLDQQLEMVRGLMGAMGGARGGAGANNN